MEFIFNISNDKPINLALARYHSSIVQLLKSRTNNQ